MSLPIVCIPPILKKHLSFYRDGFSKAQFGHFSRLVTGLIVSPNKTLQEINDGFGKRNQSNLNRFVSQSDWDIEKRNSIRLNQAKLGFDLKKKGIQLIDESLLHKTGRHMELTGRHRSGVTKRVEFGHMSVNSYYVDTDLNKFPIKTDIYVREKDCSKNNVEFKTKREIAIEQIDYAIMHNLNVGLIIVDAGYEGEKFTQEIMFRELDYIIGTRVSTKISIHRKKRITISEYLDSLTDDNFKVHTTEIQAYFYHTKNVCIRGVGHVKLIISYTYGDEENVKCYITNLSINDEKIIKLLIKRWIIECFHRDAKQHLGLEAYQVRKGRGMQVVALAILTAYTLVKLIAKSIKIKLNTIGEVCRYLTLIAYKGITWFSKLVKNENLFLKTLKRLVFVKNAKV